jgi:hypothetical protein
MNRWLSGYTLAELDGAQDRYGVRFPPDLIDLFLAQRPENGYDWEKEDSRIRDMLDWPFRKLSFDADRGYWWPDWGERPATADGRSEIIRDFLATKPRLIPVWGHRFIPETPSERGNPVFSMYGFDTIYYGANLDEYFAREFGAPQVVSAVVRRIPFWSDIAERHEIAYAYYRASDNYKKMLALNKAARIAPVADRPTR